jgi:hypothetical protein
LGLRAAAREMLSTFATAAMLYGDICDGRVDPA